MNNLKSTIAKSALYALVIGTLLACTLYVLSTWFFKAKNKQTLVQSIELGNSSEGDVVFPIGSTMPSISFTGMLNGESYSLSRDSSKVKIVNFWASWCEPCVEEFSSFARLARQFGGEVSFVGVNEDKTVEAGVEFLKAFAVDFKGIENVHFGYDPEKRFSHAYGILALPETFILDVDGKLIRRVSGFERWDSTGAVDYFKVLLERSKESL